MDTKNPLKDLSQKRIIFLSSLGGAFEMYDFVLYVYLLTYLSHVFFPSENSFLASLSLFAVFALGYFVRPLGGIIFGHFGDRVGRKGMFVLSILLMSIPIFLVGLLPSAQTAGVFATAAFIFLRILQGLAVGGEIPGAMTFTCEYVDAKKRGLASGCIYAGINYGLTLAALVAALLASVLTPEQMQLFGWRLPFLFGGLLGGVAVYLRMKVKESPLFLELVRKNHLEKIPIKALLTQHPLNVARGFFITVVGSMPLIVGFTYMKPYLMTELHYSGNFTGWFVVLSTFVCASLQILFGWLADRVGGVKLLWWGCSLIVLLGYPIFAAFTLHSEFLTVMSLLILSIVSALIIGVYPYLLVELFPTAIRYTGYAFSYNIGFALIGGLAPLTLTYFLHETQFMGLPGIYLVVGGLCGMIGLLGLKNQSAQEL